MAMAMMDQPDTCIEYSTVRYEERRQTAAPDNTAAMTKSTKLFSLPLDWVGTWGSSRVEMMGVRPPPLLPATPLGLALLPGENEEPSRAAQVGVPNTLGRLPIQGPTTVQCNATTLRIPLVNGRNGCQLVTTCIVPRYNATSRNLDKRGICNHQSRFHCQNRVL